MFIFLSFFVLGSVNYLDPTMSNRRMLCMLAIVIAVLSVTSVYGGPARSLASVMAARTAKIPRAIRAPFRNSEMMTARGFGKRSQMIKFKDGNSFLQFFSILTH